MTSINKRLNERQADIIEVLRLRGPLLTEQIKDLVFPSKRIPPRWRWMIARDISTIRMRTGLKIVATRTTQWELDE